MVYEDNEITIERLNLNSRQDKLILTIKIDNMLLYNKHDIALYDRAYYVSIGIVWISIVDNQIRYECKLYDYALVARGNIELDNYINKNILSRSIIDKVVPKQLKEIENDKCRIVFKIVIIIPKTINNDNITMLYNL